MDQSYPQADPKISLMIIGAQKAGTTSLKNYLGEHPDLQTHPHKEFSYFFDAAEHAKGYEAALNKYFPDAKENVRLVAKNAGLYVSEQGLIRLREHNPDCKIVFILRNPIERTYSSYLMEKNYGAINGTFDVIEEIISKRDITDWRYEFFVGMSLYREHLAVVYRHFPREQVKLIRYEEMEANAPKVCADIFRWIGVNESFIPDTAVRYNVTHMTRSPSYGRFLTQLLRNQSSVKKIFQRTLPGKMHYKVGEMLRNLNKSDRKYDPISPKIAAVLAEFYEPYNRQLSELTGMDFSDWNFPEKK